MLGGRQLLFMRCSAKCAQAAAPIARWSASIPRSQPKTRFEFSMVGDANCRHWGTVSCARELVRENRVPGDEGPKSLPGAHASRRQRTPEDMLSGWNCPVTKS
jgi:hypothetical protein